MKFNSKLWMLAVAMATVGCQDDLENGPVTGTEGVDGPQTYMTVSINSETVTKAPQGEDGKPTGGENGDDFEVGTANEYTVHDVTVVLFRNAGGTGELAPINASSELVAAGYNGEVGDMTNGTEPHSRQATVEITITDAGIEFDGRTFGVIGITNLGNEELKNAIGTTINNGADLADYLQKTAWSGDAYTDATEGGANHFVMSSHLPELEDVTLRAGATATDAPVADIHVERLAAKVRVNELTSSTTEGGTTTTTGNQFVYTVMDETQTTPTAIAKVRLDQAAIINKQSVGSYMLKRVSEKYSANPTALANTPTSDVYLGDEAWGGSSFNYVIDPWTRNKPTTYSASVLATDEMTALAYDNQFGGDSYADMWTVLASDSKKQLAHSAETATVSKMHLAYTLENTQNAEVSLNGYSTGVLFKATYVPATLSDVNAEGTAIIQDPVDEYESFSATSTTTIRTYYMVKSGLQWIAYADRDAIWADYCWDVQTGVESPIGYTDFSSANITNLTKQAYLASNISKSDVTRDATGYAAWLNEQCEGVDPAEETPFTAAESFDTYIASHATGVVDADGNGSIREVVNGECYYPYWIRHANNNNDAVMGIMEFGIVRNNIYDLTVSEISGFGFAAGEKPNPDDPNESNEIFFKVNLFVHDWVIRSNSGIIL